MLFMPWTLDLCSKRQVAQTDFSFGLTWGFSISTLLLFLGVILYGKWLTHCCWPTIRLFLLQAEQENVPRCWLMAPEREGQSSWALADSVDHLCSAGQEPCRLAFQLIDETHDSYVDLFQDPWWEFTLPGSILSDLGCVDFRSFLLRFWPINVFIWMLI